MGLVNSWIEEVLAHFLSIGMGIENVPDPKYILFKFSNKALVIHFLSLKNEYDPTCLIAIQQQYADQHIYLLQLWEDVWISKKQQVIGRINSILGLNKRLHGRKTKIIALSQKHANDFLIANHLQASAGAKYRFGLTIDDKLIAVACFSKLRLMKLNVPNYRSAELIRFASLVGYTVTGGFSKLLRHFIKLVQPDDVMSYADRDWSLGKAYEKAGFHLVDITPPTVIWLQKSTKTRYFEHRLPIDFVPLKDQDIQHDHDLNDYVRIFNTGNLKYILYLKAFIR